MAVMTPGTSAPTLTRTRRLHGGFSIGTFSAAIFSSRARHDAAVIVDLGSSAATATGRLTPMQARSAARALLQAAEAVELAQRRVTFTRGA